MTKDEIVQANVRIVDLERQVQFFKRTANARGAEIDRLKDENRLLKATLGQNSIPWPTSTLLAPIPMSLHGALSLNIPSFQPPSSPSAFTSSSGLASPFWPSPHSGPSALPSPRPDLLSVDWPEYRNHTRTPSVASFSSGASEYAVEDAEAAHFPPFETRVRSKSAVRYLFVILQTWHRSLTETTLAAPSAAYSGPFARIACHAGARRSA